jgi:hypothetical protein
MALLAVSGCTQNYQRGLRLENRGGVVSAFSAGHFESLERSVVGLMPILRAHPDSVSVSPLWVIQ